MVAIVSLERGICVSSLLFSSSSSIFFLPKLLHLLLSSSPPSHLTASSQAVRRRCQSASTQQPTQISSLLPLSISLHPRSIPLPLIFPKSISTSSIHPQIHTSQPPLPQICSLPHVIVTHLLHRKHHRRRCFFTGAKATVGPPLLLSTVVPRLLSSTIRANPAISSRFGHLAHIAGTPLLQQPSPSLSTAADAGPCPLLLHSRHHPFFLLLWLSHRLVLRPAPLAPHSSPPPASPNLVPSSSPVHAAVAPSSPQRRTAASQIHRPPHRSGRAPLPPLRRLPLASPLFGPHERSVHFPLHRPRLSSSCRHRPLHFLPSPSRAVHRFSSPRCHAAVYRRPAAVTAEPILSFSGHATAAPPAAKPPLFSLPDPLATENPSSC